jgi:hypothetical protein
MNRKRRPTDQDRLIAPLLARVEATKILLTVLLADRFERDPDGPKRAAERAQDSLFVEFNRVPGVAAIALSEEAAAIVDAAQRIALTRSSSGK